MPENVIDQLKQIKKSALHHKKSPKILMNAITKTCKSKFDIKKFYNEFGLVTRNEAVDLLSNNIISAKRQHDLADAEVFREQRNSLDPLSKYFIETIHGCHIAPTVHPLTHQDIADLIVIIQNKLK